MRDVCIQLFTYQTVSAGDIIRLTCGLRCFVPLTKCFTPKKIKKLYFEYFSLKTRREYNEGFEIGSSGGQVSGCDCLLRQKYC